MKQSARLDLLRRAAARVARARPICSRSAPIPELWTRHVADSLQLLDLAPEARIWVDLGSAPAFPGFVDRLRARGSRRARSPSGRKQRQEGRVPARGRRDYTGAPAIVHAERIERFGEELSGKPDVVTARALAPLNRICSELVRLVENGALGLFPKGQDVEAELTEAAKYWNIKANLVPSKTSSEGRIVVRPRTGTARSERAYA